MNDSTRKRDRLRPPGSPIEVGETVAFSPAEIGPTSAWLEWDFAVIEQIDSDAESFRFHFVGNPSKRAWQGLENVVRPTPTYHAWRAAWEAAFDRTHDEAIADAEIEELRVKVLAEHPLHGYRIRGTEGPTSKRPLERL